jgi:hypothetical protein
MDGPAFSKGLRASQYPSQDYFKTVSLTLGLALEKNLLPACNEVFEVVTPFDAKVWLILQLRNWLSHDICQ